MLFLVLLSCAADPALTLPCNTLILDPAHTLDGDGRRTEEPCFTPRTDTASGDDYTPCCPDGYEAEGFTAVGEVVCVAESCYDGG